MAESSAATQSPSVSSSSSGAEPSAPGGGGSPGACPALGAKSCGSSCADSFVSSSSSQPVSLFSTSQEELHSIGSNEPPAEIMASSCISSSETCNTDLTTFHGEGEVLGGHPVLAHEDKAHWALPAPREVPKPQGTSSCGADAPGAHRDHPSIPVSSQERPALLLKEVGQLEQQIKTDESEKLNEVAERKAAVESGSGGRFTLLTAQTPPAACSLSPSEASGGGSMEKDSPGSPFEVILDKAAFDKEFKDSYKESMKAFGSWAGHADEESPADKLESDDKVFPLRSEEAGRYPASALLARQFSHTTAALEEVSRCVSDMHNFTNEVLTWDLDPHVKQSTDKSSDHNTKTGPDVNKCQPDIPVVHLKTKIHQKIPVCSFSGNTSITKPTGDDLAEISLPQENARPAHASSVKDTRGSEQKQDDTLSELSRSPSEKPVPLGPGAVLPEVDWQNPGVGEVAEADSSGESDDTVIEDIAAGASAEDYKVQMESPGSIPSAVANTGGRAVQELSACRREGKTSEDPEEGVCTSEPHPAQPHVPGRKLLGEVAPSQVPDVSVPEEGGKPSGNVAEAAPQMPVTTEKQKLPVGISAKVFSETDVTSYTYSTPFLGKDVKDMDDSSPEDLITAFTKTRGKGTVGAGETKARDSASQKTTGCKASLPAEALPGSEPGPSDVEGVKRRRSEQAEGVSGSKCQDAVPAQSVPAASPDLEQEQLTIQALKELGERQAEMSAATPGEETARRTVAPGAWPRRSCAIPEQTGVSPASGPDPGIPKRPAVTQEASRVDNGSSLSTTELVNTHALARLLADFSVHDLIFWRDVKKTGFVFGTTLIMLLSLAAFSVISVVSYLILALLSVTISFRVYKSVIQAVQKSEEGHPFKAYLDVDITLSSEAFHNYMNAAMVHINRALRLTVRLFLVEDLVDSLKLAVFMWLMTYVGAVFNGITLLILAELLVFSVPIVYEKYKTQIDHYVGIAREQTKSIVEKIQAKLPGIAKKKAE